MISRIPKNAVDAVAADPQPAGRLGHIPLRLLLDQPDILAAQARALLRALQNTEGRLLVPMVTSIEDLAAVRASLEREKLPLPPLGVMIEMPSALLHVMIGKTNLDEFGMGSSCDTSALDRTSNPWDTNWWPADPAAALQRQ